MRGLDRRPAVHGLEVERAHELEADVGAEHRGHAEVGAHQRAGAQDAEPDERLRGAQLDRHERDQQGDDERERADDRGVAPADFGRLDHGADEQQHGGGDRERAGDVVAPPRAGDDPVARDHTPRQDQDRQRERDREQEGPAPAQLGQQAAEHEAEREAARPGGGVVGERPVAVRALRERRRDDRQPGRRGERGAHALDHAGDDEQRAVVDETADRGGDEEHAQPDQQHPPAAEQVGGAAAEQQQAAVAEHVAGHDPLELRRGQAELGADRRQRHADHRHVEPVEEEDAAEHDQERPGAGVPAWCDGAWGGSHSGKAICICNYCLRIFCERIICPRLV